MVKKNMSEWYCGRKGRDSSWIGTSQSVEDDVFISWMILSVLILKKKMDFLQKQL